MHSNEKYKGERIQDSTPKSFSYQKEQEIDLGSIKGVDIYIYSCEKRDTDNGTGPKYPDDKGRAHDHRPKSQLTACFRCS